MNGKHRPQLDYDPYSPSALADPYPWYDELLATGEPYWLEQYSGWAITRFDHVWDLLTLSDGTTITEGPLFEPEVIRQSFDPSRLHPEPDDPITSFSTLDKPELSTLRKAIMPQFSARAVKSWAEFVEAELAQAYARVEGRAEFDLINEVLSPVSAALMREILGIGKASPDEIQAAVNRSSSRMPPGATADGKAAREELVGFLSEVVSTGGRTASSQELVERLRAVELRGRRLEDAEIINQLITLLVGGVETIPKILAQMVMALVDTPALTEIATGDVERNAVQAFEEGMRLFGPLQYVGRTATEPRQVGTAQVEPGHRLFLFIAAANRDPREFDRPNEFIWNRPQTRHLALGRGPHFCLGAHLARMEGRVMVQGLLPLIGRLAVDKASIVVPPSDFQVGISTGPRCRFADK